MSDPLPQMGPMQTCKRHPMAVESGIGRGQGLPPPQGAPDGVQHGSTQVDLLAVLNTQQGQIAGLIAQQQAQATQHQHMIDTIMQAHQQDINRRQIDSANDRARLIADFDARAQAYTLAAQAQEEALQRRLDAHIASLPERWANST